MNKPMEESIIILEVVTSKEKYSPCGENEKVKYEVNNVDLLKAELDALSLKFNKLEI